MHPVVKAFTQAKGRGAPVLAVSVGSGGGDPIRFPFFGLRLEPPTGVIITYECILTHILQSIVLFSPVPMPILPMQYVPQYAHDNDISTKVRHSLERELS